MWGKLTIGSNVIANSSGVLLVEGKEQIALERSDNDGQLLLTMDVYDAAGKRIAKLRRNSWVYVADRDKFEITRTADTLKLSDKATGQVVVDAKVGDRDGLELSRGSFYTPSGVPIEIAPTYLKIAGITLTGNYIEAGGAAIEIGTTGGVGIGVAKKR